MYNSSNGAPGSIVYSTTDINNQSILDGYGYGHVGYQGNSQCAGSNPPWWCLKFKSVSNLMSFLWLILIFTALSVGFITLTYVIYGRTTSIEQDAKLQEAAIRGRLRTSIIEKMQGEKSSEKLAKLQKHLDWIEAIEKLQKPHVTAAVPVASSAS